MVRRSETPAELAASVGGTRLSAAKLIDGLQGVRCTGPGRWVALCPSHDDRNPSLAVRELDDGTILVKCFAGCSTSEVISAVGLALKDLFPRPAEHCRRPSKAWMDARDVLACLALEGQVIAVAASDLSQGLTFSGEDADRVAVAAGRVSTAWGVFNGHP